MCELKRTLRIQSGNSRTGFDVLKIVVQDVRYRTTMWRNIKNSNHNRLYVPCGEFSVFDFSMQKEFVAWKQSCAANAAYI